MEILLTPEGIRQAIDYALIEKPVPEVTAEFLYRTVARAQVKRVVDEYEKAIAKEAPCVDPLARECGECPARYCPQCKAEVFMRALRKAGGEG